MIVKNKIGNSTEYKVYRNLTYKISNSKNTSIFPSYPKTSFKVNDVKSYIYHLISYLDNKDLIKIIAFDVKSSRGHSSFWCHHPKIKDKEFEDEIESKGDLEVISVRIELQILVGVVKPQRRGMSR